MGLVRSFRQLKKLMHFWRTRTEEYNGYAQINKSKDLPPLTGSSARRTLKNRVIEKAEINLREPARLLKLQASLWTFWIKGPASQQVTPFSHVSDHGPRAVHRITVLAPHLVGRPIGEFARQASRERRVSEAYVSLRSLITEFLTLPGGCPG